MTPLTVQLRQAILGFGPTNVREILSDVALMNAADPGSEQAATWFARQARLLETPLLDPWQHAMRLAQAAAAQTIADMLEQGITADELEQMAERLEALRGPVIRATANASRYRDA